MKDSNYIETITTVFAVLIVTLLLHWFLDLSAHNNIREGIKSLATVYEILDTSLDYKVEDLEKILNTNENFDILRNDNTNRRIKSLEDYLDVEYKTTDRTLPKHIEAQETETRYSPEYIVYLSDKDGKMTQDTNAINAWNKATGCSK